MPKDIYTLLQYRDGRKAIDWLEQAFGFERVSVHDGPDGTVGHAELRYGGGMIMLSSQKAGADDGSGEFGDHTGQGWLYVVVEDPDAHCAQAKAAGAQIVRELEDQDYGSREYSARDFEGNLWSFGTYGPE